MSAPSQIDLSRLPVPPAIEPLSYDQLLQQYDDACAAAWLVERERDPSLPVYEDVIVQSALRVIVGQAAATLRLLDRARVNDAVKAVLAPLARGGDLDHVVARQGVARLVLAPAVGLIPAVLESDASLLRRYLLSFDRPSAGSAARYLYEAWTAVPLLHDVKVNGRAVHGRVGDTDVVILGADGAVATDEERSAVQAAISAAGVKPEAVGVAAIKAGRTEYRVEQTIRVPVGPDAELVRLEAVARVEAVTRSRMLIGAAVPRDLVAGAAFGSSIIDVVHRSPAADIPAQAYAAPVCTEISIDVEVVQ